MSDTKIYEISDNGLNKIRNDAIEECAAAIRARMGGQKKQQTARQALIDSMAAVSIRSPEQMADMVLTGLGDRGYTITLRADINFHFNTIGRLTTENGRLHAALKQAADDLDENGLPVEARKARHALKANDDS